MKNNKQNLSGITLISLVVTVIVLLILAGISISMLTGNNGIILNAGNAKEQSELAKEKELIETVVIKTINKSKFGEIKQENLQKRLDKEFGEEKKAKTYEEDEGFSVLVENRLYMLDKDGNVELIDPNFEFPKREFVAQLSDDEYGVSEDKPYEINCIEDLLDFSFKVNGIEIQNNEITYLNQYNNFNNKFVALVRNLNFKSGLSYENAKRLDYGDVNQDGKVEELLTELTTGKGWICIGYYGETKNTNGFFGSFEGNSKKISNLYINDNEEKITVGLFGRIYGNGEKFIRNLGVSGNILCNSRYAGGPIGHFLILLMQL